MKFIIKTVAVFLLLFYATCSADVTSGLISHWSLDNTLQDQGALTNDGIITGQANFQAGKNNQAMVFDGSSYVSIPNEADYDFTGPMTISAWFIADFNIPNQTIISKGGSFHIHRDYENDTLIFRCDGMGRPAAGTISVNDNNWHHVAGVYDGSTISIYIDGQLDFSKSAGLSLLTNDYELRIGSNAEYQDRNWQGVIDEVRVYNRALTLAEIAEIGEGFLAKAINPVSGSMASAENLTLNWRPGYQSEFHDIYFGTDPLSVENATNSSPEYKGNQSLENTSFIPSNININQKYYWRIDEIQQGITYKGNIWNFTTQNPNLLGWWKLDALESSITTPDSSLYNNDAVLISEPTFVEGKIDNALKTFAAQNQYLEIENESSFDITSEITLAGWINMYGWQRWEEKETVIAKGDSWMLQRNNGNSYDGILGFKLKGVTPSVGIETDYEIADYKWHHIAATYDGSEMKIYVDAKIVSSSPANGNITTNNNKVTIAYNPSVTGDYLIGKLDDWRVYKNALNDAEIAKLAQKYYLCAFNPLPNNNQTGVDKNLGHLVWSHSGFEDNQDIYFGTDLYAVQNATTTSDEYQLSQPNDVNCLDLETLETGQNYYWRVDQNYGNQTYKGETWKFTIQPANAWKPNPIINAIVEPDRTLSWSKGEFGDSYDIYFGTNYDTVQNADHNSPAFKGNQPVDANSYDPGPLELGKKYYWRIEQISNLGK